MAIAFTIVAAFLFVKIKIDTENFTATISFINRTPQLINTIKDFRINKSTQSPSKSETWAKKSEKMRTKTNADYLAKSRSINAALK